MNMEDRLARLEKKLFGSYYSDRYPTSFTLVLCYVSEVSEDGHHIKVSPWNSTEIHEAIPLSSIPTNLLDGRRLQGIPVAKFSEEGKYDGGDRVLCAVLDKRWYILGYFNLPDSETGDAVSLATNFENIKPFTKGVIWKLSKIASIVFRENNWIKMFLGSLAKIDIKGEDFNDLEREPQIEITFPNFIKRAWGGFTKWLRVVDENTSQTNWLTSFIDVKTRAYELDGISDVNLQQKEKNEDIEDETQVPGGDPPINYAKLNYIDKVIKRAGNIEGNTHIYEREIRQSKEADKEKTVFTRLREGYREGVLSEYETEDVLSSVKTDEKFGADIGDNTRIFIKEYKRHDGSEDQLPLDGYLEEFGQGQDDLYKKKIFDEAGNFVQTQMTGEAIVVTVGNGEENSFTLTQAFDGTTTLKLSEGITLNVDADTINFGHEPDTKLVRYDELKAALEEIWSFVQDHDHNTGIGPSTPAKSGAVSASLLPTAIQKVTKAITDMESQNTSVK